MAREWSDDAHAEEFDNEANDLLACIDRSLADTDSWRDGLALPASPYRRMDAGAIGSIVADYPLQILPPNNPRMRGTLEFLLRRQLVRGAFFQDMIHSGINPYLTLQLAQVLLRARDERWVDLTQAVAKLASPTGQWPEAVHPKTGGGCMGDGQHAWAAAEWAQLMRNLFVREEPDRLVLASGCHKRLFEGRGASLGPTLTPWGPVTVEIRATPASVVVKWTGKWHKDAPPIEVAPPGFAAVPFPPGNGNSGEAAFDLDKARDARRIPVAADAPVPS